MADEPVLSMNESEVEWGVDRSPKGTFECHYREMSRWLTVESKISSRFGRNAPGRPFEVELVRIPPGRRLCPRHAHSVQWEYYIVRSGHGQMLQAEGEPPLPMQPGDHLLQPAGWVHTVENNGTEELCYYVIADNPVDEHVYYPDSDKWSAARHVFRMQEADYFDGEE